jgi:hypothetical protein
MQEPGRFSSWHLAPPIMFSLVRQPNNAQGQRSQDDRSSCLVRPRRHRRHRLRAHLGRPSSTTPVITTRAIDIAHHPANQDANDVPRHPRTMS